MKAIAIVRTRNEERNIERFCQSYSWANKILVADGGSEDNTMLLASKFPNVEVREFTERIEMENDLWRNPEAEHLNFLVEWAEDEGADWIFVDDCDCVPNWWLRHHMCRMLPGLDKKHKYIYAVRLYLWGEDKHFPKLAKPKGEWCPSLWGWSVYTGLRFINTRMAYTHDPQPAEGEKFEFTPPYCLKHYAWDKDIAEQKVAFYRESGQIPDMRHPLEFGGKLEDLPDWATL